MIIHPLDFSSSSIFFGTNIVMGRLISDPTLAVIMPGRVILNYHILPIDLIG